MALNLCPVERSYLRSFPILSYGKASCALSLLLLRCSMWTPMVQEGMSHGLANYKAIVTNRLTSYRLVLFQVTASQVYRGFELIPFVFLGVIGGVFGHYFIRLNIAYAKFRASDLSRGPILEVAVVALLTALVSYLVVYARQALG